MATQSSSVDGADERMLGPRLTRCRQWLLPRRRTSTGSGVSSTYAGVAGGCPDRFDGAYTSAGLGVCPERFDGAAGVLSTASSNRSLGSRRAGRYHQYYCAQQQQQQQQQGARTASYSSASLDSGVAARLAPAAPAVSASTVFSAPDTHTRSHAVTHPLPMLSDDDDDDDDDSAPNTAVSYDEAASDDEYSVIRQIGRNRHHTISGGEAAQYGRHYAHSVADSVGSTAGINGVAPAPSEGAGPAMPSAAAIAQIFRVGQPPGGAAGAAAGGGVSRARRASHWLRQRIGRRRRQRASTGELADAAVAVFAAEAALAAAVGVLAKTRSTQAAAFRGRADRVHVAQGRVLAAVHALFAGLVPADEHASRHYRFYLPEEDQAELDRGFSESVLFAAQALARGFQIRGTEPRTLALRDPAALLCAAWAALRHVLQGRGRHLWRHWCGEPPHSPAADPDADTRALRRVLADFDDAWVRFERDLCFAYFGLADASLDDATTSDADAGPGVAQEEEEFALLVVLLSESLQRAVAQGLVTQEQVDDMDPLVIVALPRLAILHAIAHAHPADALCFVPADHAPPVFWWFRDFAAHTARISAALARTPPPLHPVLMRMLVAADDADVALAQHTALAQHNAPPSPVSSTTATAATRRMTMDDLESIIDSPRSARSMSIDCISSICASDLPAYNTPPSPLLPRSCPHQQQLQQQLQQLQQLQHHHQLQAAKDAAIIAESHHLMKQIYVDLCTVADSLHSGPFARPFRVALELVFRMNLAADNNNDN
ncbi:hypothetical protein GGI24_001295 [Coemansia furcata]|nr:hypothetical protein GGI24_001295 [Coemansia furcata]